MSAPIMGTSRLEAFSDGVIAIIITIMVLELRVPHGDDPRLLLDIWPVFFSYGVSYLTVAIYWVNHHRLLHQSKRVDNSVLWSNILWLFCQSLIPFATAYMGQNQFTHFSTALYGLVMLINAFAFFGLRKALAREFQDDAAYQAGYRAASRKHAAAISCYGSAVAVAFASSYLALLLIALVAAAYFIPDAWIGKVEAAVEKA